ncbi:hypothetical protein GCM10010230_31260 [Streptomyces narbonensis]|nr:hypothetical protein GCM10010230_31260 [Streptomyces narbonensis]
MATGGQAAGSDGASGAASSILDIELLDLRAIRDGNPGHAGSHSGMGGVRFALEPLGVFSTGGLFACRSAGNRHADHYALRREALQVAVDGVLSNWPCKVQRLTARGRER